ncbi:MAG: hypothetical protein O2973_13835, partial [Gemmatimonadetes bacterium]|nr:hypothetical protein [Gemmatimonadota bacterium]
GLSHERCRINADTGMRKGCQTSGGIIPAGDELFRVDHRDYQAAVEEASLAVEQGRQKIERLKEELRRNGERVETIRRNRDLAAKDYERVRDLLEQDVGAQAELDLAEKALNAANDLVSELEKHLAVGPLMIREAEASIKAAGSGLARAQRQLDRCRVTTAFRARVVHVGIEKGQFVRAGMEVAALADDSTIEVRVPLDARQSHRWLQFNEHAAAAGDTAWFDQVKSVPCRVAWTEAPDTHAWTGTLHRIEQLSAETRTLTVVVRVSGSQASNARGFPLVEGMFCAVEIPGATLEGVYRVPLWAVTVDQCIYKAVDGRLVTQSVRVAHTVGDYAVIDQGLEPGTILIVTRLNDPMENSLLDLKLVTAAEALP